MERGKDFFLKYALIMMLLMGGTMHFFSPCVWAKVYTIHVASFQVAQQAQEDVGRLKALGYDAFMQEVQIPGRGKWFRVYAGRYDTHQKASVAGARMKNKKEIKTVFIYKVSDIHSTAAAKTDKSAAATASVREKIQVVGNTHTKRYHLPGMPYYDKVKKNHRVVFQSEKEAVDHGYYKAGTGMDVKEKEQMTVSGDAARKVELNPPGAGVKRSENRLAGRDQASRKEEFQSLIIGKAKITKLPAQMDDVVQEKGASVPAPNEPEVPEPPSESDLYNRALEQQKAGQYAQALITFKAFIDRQDTSKEWGQRALRRMADCHFELGKAGDRQELLIASEFYKNTLASFPDPRKENAWTYYRLAQTYEALKYYPEAIKQYKNMIIKYPDAIYVPEAWFKIGEVYYVDGKYIEAAESLIQYLMKHRGKAKAKISYYMIAHSYYKAKQSTNAEIWFRDAQKKWPSLMDVPREIVADLAFHKMSLRRYDEAIAPLSFYVNLYPTDEKIKEVLWALAEAYRLNGQVAAALAVYHKMIEKYPGAAEEGACRLKMAALGVDSPGAKVFRGVSGMDNYKFPMDTYDDLIMKNAVGDIAEQAMLQKADALVKKGQRRKAADVYLEFLSLFPESPRIPDASRGLKSAAADLIDEYFAKKDHLAVAYVYFRSFGALPLQSDEYPQVQKIASSLKALNLMEDYSNLLKRYLKVAKDEKLIQQASMDLSEGFILQGQYDEAEKTLTALMNKPSVRKTPLWTAIRKNLAEIAYRKEQYAQAVANYSAVVGSGHSIQNPGVVYSHYAKSLKEEKENTQALQTYLTAVDYLSAEKNEKGNMGIAYKEIGDLYVHSNKLGVGLSMYAKALDYATQDEMKLWSQFLVGKTYLALDQPDQAQNIFAQMKAAAGPESFWGKVVDFYAVDVLWWNKYGYLIRK